MAGTLRDELASLKIERRNPLYRPVRAERAGGGWLGAALLWLIPLSIVGGAGAFAYTQYERIRPRPKVTTALVQSLTPGEAETLLSAKGYLHSRTQAMIGAKVPGRVERIDVEEGDRVAAGQVLAVLEHNDLKAQLESRRAQVERSEAELQEARVNLRDKERKAVRAARLRSQGVLSIEDLEKDQTDRDMAAARVRALEAAIAWMAASAHEIEETIRDMHIVAPFDGTIIGKEAEVGETITPGGMGAASGRGSVVTLADLRHLEVETDVAENLLSRVAVGQPAEISVSAVPGQHYRGRLRQIIPMGDRSRGTVKVNVEVLDPDDRLFPDLVATVHFLPDAAVNTPDVGRASLFVPKASIVEEGGHAHVWVVDGPSVVRRRRVEVVITKDDLVRVESGLEAGEAVVLDPPKALREGQAVEEAD